MKTICPLLIALFLLAGCKDEQAAKEVVALRREVQELKAYIDGLHAVSLDANSKTLNYAAEESGRTYKLNDNMQTQVDSMMKILEAHRKALEINGRIMERTDARLTAVENSVLATIIRDK